MRRTLSRRRLLALGGASSSASLLAGCNLFATDPDTSGGGNGAQPKGPEAPMLAQQVANGTLPPVQERLPVNPRTIQPVDEIGRYGGRWRTALASTDPSWPWMTVVHDHLITWDPNWSELVPNVAESFEVEGNGTDYVFTLREGMKWSDGELFTADDLVFWYDAVFTNQQLTPVVSTALQIDGEPLVVEKLDDLRVKFAFASPNGLFLQHLAIHGPPFRLLPKHYLQKFHPAYNSDVESLVEQENMPDWTELFFQKMDELNNVELPVLTGWIPANPHSDGGRQVWKRNPYYFKVDPDGSQLPYIDEVEFTFFQDEGPLLLRAANGEIDMYMRAEITVPKNKPVLARNSESGNYRLLDVRQPNHNTMGLCLNLTHEDPAKRAMFQNKDFRIGLSYAINRQQIVDLVFLRQGEPWQTAPRPEVPFYDSDDMGKQYTEFDLDRANEHLDAAGYTERDGNGRRLDENGRPVVVSVLTPTRYPVMVDALELMKGTWAEVGVELRIDNVAPELAGTRMEANQFDCTVDNGELGYVGMVSDPRWLFATAGSSYAPLWSRWYEGGEPQEEPPEAMRRQIQIYREQVIPRIELEDQFDGMRQIIEIARDEFWTMGISLPAGSYAIVTDRFRNVPEGMWLAFKCPYPAVTNISQYWIDDG